MCGLHGVETGWSFKSLPTQAVLWICDSMPWFVRAPHTPHWSPTPTSSVAQRLCPKSKGELGGEAREKKKTTTTTQKPWHNNQDFYLGWSLLGSICMATMSDALFMSINCSDPRLPRFANTGSRFPRLDILLAALSNFSLKGARQSDSLIFYSCVGLFKA